MVTKVRKWGNSQGVRLPRSILDEANVAIGDVVTIVVHRGIIVEPVTKVRGKQI